MYKARLKSWRITKYHPEAIMAALAMNIERRKLQGKRTLIYKNNAHFNTAKIESHLKKKDMTMDQLLRNTPSDAPMPDSFTCVTPPQQLGDTPSSPVSAFTPLDHVGLSQTPPTSVNDSGLSSSGHIPTPQSTPNESEGDFQTPALFQTFEAEPTSDIPPWTVADPFNDCGPDLFQATGQSLGNFATDYFSQSSRVDISGEALFLTSPGIFPLNNQLDVNLHTSMSTYMQNPDCYQPLHCHTARVSQRSLSTPSDLQPAVFLSHCYLACILHGQGQQEEASTVASKAFKIYQVLIKQEHEQALACLNLVLAVLFIYGQRLFAVDLLKNAHQAALCHLHSDNPIIVTISFMVQQASRTVMQCGISTGRLRVVFDDFRESRTLKHPYTLLAGYHLAWRLAMDGGDSLEQAHHLLSDLQAVADHNLGKAHMQTIAILTTKARVLYDLRHRDEAEKLMSEAIRRIELAYPAKHPYALEAKRRHSIFLYAVNKNCAAEKRLIEVALGRIDVLGPDHTFSKESVKDVEKFLSTPGRDNQLSGFAANLAEAITKSRTSNSTRTLQFL
jgi:hypothetical protein